MFTRLHREKMNLRQQMRAEREKEREATARVVREERFASDCSGLTR